MGDILLRVVHSTAMVQQHELPYADACVVLCRETSSWEGLTLASHGMGVLSATYCPVVWEK